MSLLTALNYFHRLSTLTELSDAVLNVCGKEGEYVGGVREVLVVW